MHKNASICVLAVTILYLKAKYRSIENEAMAAILILSILINHSYFS